VDEILSGLKVTAESGVDTASIEMRTHAFGDHANEPPTRTGFWMLVWESL
jgi:hypothetical protein